MTFDGSSLRVCVIQFASLESLAETLAHLEEIILKAVNQYQPQIIALPECFHINYETDSTFLKKVAETIVDGPTCRMLSKLSEKFGVFIVGGSIIERDGVNLYNTSTVWNPNGELIARHRKVHLCDTRLDSYINIEVDKLTAGNSITTFQVNDFKCGVAICYDANFDEFIKLYGRSGCDLLFVPAAYHVDSGPTYWELVHRARAIDNQFFVAAISPARNEQTNYVVYGHSMIIDPVGQILTEAETSEEIIFHEIDLNAARKIRKSVPLLAGRRTDVFKRYNDIPNFNFPLESNI